MYSIKALIKLEESFILRKLLSENSFSILVIDKYTAEPHTLVEDYSIEERIIYTDDLYICVAVYNGSTLPDQNILKWLEDPCIYEFTLRKTP